MKRETSVEEVNDLVEAWANQDLKGILGFERRPLVSADYVNDPRSAIVDALSTMVVNSTQVKVYAWYDNEWGYACRLADVTRLVAKRRSEEHTSELQSLMRSSYAVFCLKKKNQISTHMRK